MSEPAPSAPSRDATRPESGAKRGARPARWIDRLSVLLLVAAPVVVIAVATPAILRAAGLELVVLGDPRAAASASPHRAPPPPKALPPALSDDESPRLTELERLYPDGMWPGQHPRDAWETPSATNPRSGHTLTPLTLREHPDASATVTGHLPAGVRLMMVREYGEWTMVVYQSPDGLLVGWTKRDTLTRL